MPMTWSGEELDPPDLRKPLKGDFLIERKERRKDIDAHEDEQKAIVRARDRRCRWPKCEVCRRFKNMPLEVAHVVQAKGMSSDRTGERSTADLLMLLDRVTHAAQERHDKRIEPLTDAGTNGACEFWQRDARGWFLVAREIAPFYYEKD